MFGWWNVKRVRHYDPVGNLMLTYQQKYYRAARARSDLYVAVERFLEGDLDLDGLRAAAETSNQDHDDRVLYIPARFRTNSDNPVAQSGRSEGELDAEEQMGRSDS